MENTTLNKETALYRVFDEMAFETVHYSNDINDARDVAHNYQAVLINNQTDQVIYDYSC